MDAPQASSVRHLIPVSWSFKRVLNANLITRSPVKAYDRWGKEGNWELDEAVWEAKKCNASD